MLDFIIINGDQAFPEAYEIINLNIKKSFTLSSGKAFLIQ
tara:strand:+ start:1127 stop:1246 length:120 start_codon:yes stop_codon:yes gene_type:complete